jgi:hypothetical protein
MENQEIDIENDHETTSAAHNMENQQRDIENDLETTSAAPDDVAFAIEEFTVGQFVYVEYDDQNYPGKILKLNESLAHKVPIHFLHLSVWLAVLTLAQLFIPSLSLSLPSFSKLVLVVVMHEGGGS